MFSQPMAGGAVRPTAKSPALSDTVAATLTHQLITRKYLCTIWEYSFPENHLLYSCSASAA